MNGERIHRGGTEGTENGEAKGSAAVFVVHSVSSVFLRDLRASAVKPCLGAPR